MYATRSGPVRSDQCTIIMDIAMYTNNDNVQCKLNKNQVLTNKC